MSDTRSRDSRQSRVSLRSPAELTSSSPRLNVTTGQFSARRFYGTPRPNFHERYQVQKVIDYAPRPRPSAIGEWPTYEAHPPPFPSFKSEGDGESALPPLPKDEQDDLFLSKTTENDVLNKTSPPNELQSDEDPKEEINSDSDGVGIPANKDKQDIPRDSESPPAISTIPSILPPLKTQRSMNQPQGTERTGGWTGRDNDYNTEFVSKVASYAVRDLFADYPQECQSAGFDPLSASRWLNGERYTAVIADRENKHRSSNVLKDYLRVNQTSRDSIGSSQQHLHRTGFLPPSVPNLPFTDRVAENLLRQERSKKENGKRLVDSVFKSAQVWSAQNSRGVSDRNMRREAQTVTTVDGIHAPVLQRPSSEEQEEGRKVPKLFSKAEDRRMKAYTEGVYRRSQNELNMYYSDDAGTATPTHRTQLPPLHSTLNQLSHRWPKGEGRVAIEGAPTARAVDYQHFSSSPLAVSHYTVGKLGEVDMTTMPVTQRSLARSTQKQPDEQSDDEVASVDSDWSVVSKDDHPPPHNLKVPHGVRVVVTDDGQQTIAGTARSYYTPHQIMRIDHSPTIGGPTRRREQLVGDLHLSPLTKRVPNSEQTDSPTITTASITKQLRVASTIPLEKYATGEWMIPSRTTDKPTYFDFEEEASETLNRLRDKSVPVTAETERNIRNALSFRTEINDAESLDATGTTQPPQKTAPIGFPDANFGATPATD
ncbi:hypothetical protein BLNAU_13581 [Blattamonas nauphoetae]|uniref:Uncharacterized protein n=1 Tax=Blattamonas nauphoetae TaxID=2049346 RepID=A0ABQ9XI87_9EUKA|nr:hypothetical protein BLNAU_13581 [Blattamonas nauphoetae]